MAEPTACPVCGSLNVETTQDEVDIGVGIQYGPLSMWCHDCERMVIEPKSIKELLDG